MIDVKLQLDIWIVRQHVGELRPKNDFGGVFATSNADSPRGTISQFAKCHKLGFDLVEPWRYYGQHPFPCLGGGYASRCPVKQPNAEPLFQTADHLAKGRC